MPPEGIPPNVRALVTERIDSVAQLETLLLLHALAAPSPGGSSDHGALQKRGARDASAVAGALRIADHWASQILDELVREGLIAEHDVSGHRVYRFPVENAGLLAAVEQLRAVYAERRVSVISLIFSKPPSPVKSFADAFRLRPTSPPPPPPSSPSSPSAPVPPPSAPNG